MRKEICIDDLQLECGAVLSAPTVAFHSWGTLNEQGDNAIVVCHSLTSNSDAASWWAALIGPGRVLDTNDWFVICLNCLGSPYGSTSPISINPATGKPYGATFPDITIRDTVRAHREALRKLGVQNVFAAIGGSMGGMQVLEWSVYGDFVGALIPIAVGAAHSPWGIAWTEAQRQSIYADPLWKDGTYSADAPPTVGLAAARRIAMISYRSATEFDVRFGRSDAPTGRGFAVESWLEHHGDKLVDRFDANCYVHLTRQMNSHDVARGRGPLRNVLRAITQPALVIGITSDLLYPIEEQVELDAYLYDSRLHVLEAPFGHDSFLIEAEEIAVQVRAFFSDLTVTSPVSIRARA